MANLLPLLLGGVAAAVILKPKEKKKKSNGNGTGNGGNGNGAAEPIENLVDEGVYLGWGWRVFLDPAEPGFADTYFARNTAPNSGKWSINFGQSKTPDGAKNFALAAIHEAETGVAG